MRTAACPKVAWPVKLGRVMSQLDLNLLRVFDALLTERSVTRAAARLNLTQSATSSALARLREGLNDPLFVRSATGLVPTARAEALAGPIRAALDQIRAALDQTLDFDPGQAAQRFTIRAPDHTLTMLLPELLPVLGAQAPHLQFDFQPIGGADIYEQLRLGDLDILISYLFGAQPEALKTLRLFTETSTVVSRRGTRPAALTLDDYIAAEHVVLRPTQTWLTSPIDRELQKRGLARQVRTTVASHMIALVVVESSDLLASVPQNLAQRHARDHAIDIHSLPFPVAGFDVSMAWHERAHHNPAHRWLRQLIGQFRDRL